MTQNERFLQGWEARRGEPLVYAPITPTLFKGHAPDAREYTYRIATFALRVFHNREIDLYEDANNAIIHLSKFFMEHTDIRDDFTSLYWYAGQLFRTFFHFGSLGDQEAGLITPEAEQLFLEMSLGYCHDNSILDDADSDPLKTWRISQSENHHVQKDSALWQLSLLLIHYGYGDAPMKDGKSLSEHFQAWSDFFETWMRERAKKSMFVEIHSKCYGVDTIKNIYPIYDFAPDPELRQLAGNMITLFWALWAEEQLHGVPGGGQSRIYPESAVTSYTQTLSWAWYYTGYGKFSPPYAMDHVVLDSSYCMPQLLLDLISHPEKRGVYTTESRPLGRALPDDLYPLYRPDTDWGDIYRYSYCTPNFILGTLMCPQLTQTDWILISSQNRFQGAVFDEPDAQLLPLPESDELHNLSSVVATVSFNSFWSMQKEGTLITQRFMNPNNGPYIWQSAINAMYHCLGRCSTPMRVWFSQAGGVREHAIEKEGWIFTYCKNAFAAVKICQGGYTWEDDLYQPGQWVRCETVSSPVILELADTSMFPTFEAFQDAVTKLAPTWDDAVMKYHSLYGHDFVFVTDGDSKDSTIDGEYYVKKPDFSFKSPFVNGAWGGDEVKIIFDGQEILLKF